MAGRPRQPIDLLIEKGKKHLTKEEIEYRRNTEVNVEAKDVKPPTYLSKKQKQEFNKIAKILVESVMMSELDEDCLARYLIANENYIRFTKQINAEFRKQNSKEAKQDPDILEKTNTRIEQLLIHQDRAFKQCRSSASDLGLSISSRCRLIMPESKNKEQPKENKFAKFKVI